MKIVLDTNTYISAFRNDGNPRAVIMRAANESDTLYITDDIIDEIKQVLKKPKLLFGEERQKRAITAIETIGKKVTVDVTHKASIDACRDKTDIKFLECAAAAKADYIISGDSDLLDLKEYNGIKIINAKDYLTIVNS